MTDLIIAPAKSAVSHHTVSTKSAVLDDAHVGDIRGALGTIKHGDTAARFEQVIRAGEADHAAAENEHVARAHVRHRAREAQCDVAT